MAESENVETDERTEKAQETGDPTEAQEAEPAWNAVGVPQLDLSRLESKIDEVSAAVESLGKTFALFIAKGGTPVSAPIDEDSEDTGYVPRVDEMKL